MILGNAKGYTKLVMALFREIGYRVQLFLVNAADCGVPQRRERVFFVALRDDLPGGKLELKLSHRWISAGEATSDLQALTAAERVDVLADEHYRKYWNATTPGEVSTNGKGKQGVFYGVRLSNKETARTLVSGTTYHHWEKFRQLTFREWKRLGSFPDDYHAKTDKIGKYMIGMSVPPKMTEQVAKAVIEQWLSKKPE
jgi:DNA (cytosine-5)-methyltransferase 1